MRNSTSKAKVKKLVNLVSELDDAGKDKLLYIAMGLNLAQGIEKGVLNDGAAAEKRLEVIG